MLRQPVRASALAFAIRRRNCGRRIPNDHDANMNNELEKLKLQLNAAISVRKFRLVTPIRNVYGRNQAIEIRCRCEREATARVSDLISGVFKQCGRCLLSPAAIAQEFRNIEI